MKYEQEDLLEKFIKNERKSKFWALLSAAAFTVVAVTVVYVAKFVTGKPGANNQTTKDTIYKRDTFYLIKNDPKVNELLTHLQDTLLLVEHDFINKAAELDGAKKECKNDIKKLQDTINTLKLIYKNYADSLAACRKKKTPPDCPPVTKINIVIKYSGWVTGTFVDSLQNQPGNSNMKIVRNKMSYEYNPVIVYFNKYDAGMEKYISSNMKNSLGFKPNNKYNSYLMLITVN
jgi:hypothetical protein